MAKPKDPFVQHVADLLGPMGPVVIRSMFGGHGVFLDGSMFGLIAEGTLYFKADSVNESQFIAAGCEPFVYQSSKGPMSLGYRRAPDDVLDDGEGAKRWALLGFEAALRARDAKLKKSKKKAVPRGV